MLERRQWCIIATALTTWTVTLQFPWESLCLDYNGQRRWPVHVLWASCCYPIWSGSENIISGYPIIVDCIADY